MADESVDRLNAVGILTRREIEARILAPVIEALGQRFGRDEVIAIVRETIAGIARDQGQALATARDDASLTTFAAMRGPWTAGGALELRVIRETPEHYDYDVTRCRYAEMYRALGIAELGEVLSCNRDAALIEGFNSDVTLERTHTIMEGAPTCDFRYRARRDREAG